MKIRRDTATTMSSVWEQILSDRLTACPCCCLLPKDARPKACRPRNLSLNAENGGRITKRPTWGRAETRVWPAHAETDAKDSTAARLRGWGAQFERSTR